MTVRETLLARIDDAHCRCAYEDEARERYLGVGPLMPFDHAVLFVGVFLNLSPLAWLRLNRVLPEDPGSPAAFAVI